MVQDNCSHIARCAEGGASSSAAALAIAQAFVSGGSQAAAMVQAVANAISQYGCSAILPTLERAH